MGAEEVVESVIVTVSCGARGLVSLCDGGFFSLLLIIIVFIVITIVVSILQIVTIVSALIKK